MLVDKARTPGLDLKSNPESDLQSTVESYKRRSNSYFRNPLVPPKGLFVVVPEQEKPAIYRTPLYQN